MSFGFGFSLPSYTVFAASGFSPASLFSGGAPGAWYDPSDRTTLFQDSAGTTPVTAVEQPVGLMLDKSQGLVLGPELVTNGDFSNGTTGWTKGSDWVISGGEATLTTTLVNQTLYQTLAGMANGKVYSISITVTAISAGSLQVGIGTVTASQCRTLNAPGTYQFTLACGALADFFRIVNLTNGTTTATIDNISVRELPGNHAFQSTAASRPVLSARVNLLLNTDGFSGATITPATGVVVVATGQPDPRGGNTARQIRNTTTTEQHRLFTSITLSGRPLFSVEVKNVDAGFVQLSCAGKVISAFGATFNLSSKTFTLVGTTPPTATVDELQNGYLRLTVLGPANETGVANVQLYILEADANTPNPSTTGTAKSVLVAGADLRPANTGVNLPPYQCVNTATDYDTVGFLPYLKFDGVDDSLSTNSINFTSTDKMSVFAGVRKLSDAATAMLVELSTDAGSVNGSFHVQASANTYGFALRGTAVGLLSATPFTAPVTNVISAVMDISQATLANELKPRINGVIPTLATTIAGPAGSGNFGNYPLYIGRRNNASLPFNGQIYSMIIVGKAVTATELSSTETYTAIKTGVTLA